MNGKFRVWDEDTHEYHRGDFSITQDGKVWLFVDEDNPPMECPSDNYIVEYSTGLKDKNGKVVLSKLGKAGSREELDAAPPMSLKIGNSRYVKLERNGKPVDLAASTKVTVARLKLE